MADASLQDLLQGVDSTLSHHRTPPRTVDQALSRPQTGKMRPTQSQPALRRPATAGGGGGRGGATGLLTTPPGRPTAAAASMPPFQRASSPPLALESPTTVMAHAQHRSPMWSPRRTAKLQGTSLTTALGFVQQDLALRRASSAANISTAEAWLEDMLQLIEIEKHEGAGEPSDGGGGAHAHGLRRARLDKQQLSAEGLSPAQVAKLHLTLFTHSFGAHHALEEMLRESTVAPAAKAAVGARFFRVLVAVCERLTRTSLHSEMLDLLHGMEDELADATHAAQGRVDLCRANEGLLKQTVAAALRRADTAEAAEAEAAAARQMLRAELPALEGALAAAEGMRRASAAAEAAAFGELDGLREELEEAARERDEGRVRIGQLVAAQVGTARGKHAWAYTHEHAHEHTHEHTHGHTHGHMRQHPHTHTHTHEHQHTRKQKREHEHEREHEREPKHESPCDVMVTLTRRWTPRWCASTARRSWPTASCGRRSARRRPTRRPPARGWTSWSPSWIGWASTAST